MRIKAPWAAVLLGVPMLFLVAFFVVPFMMVVITSLRSANGEWTLAHYARMFGDVYYLETLLATFKISLGVVILTLILGYPLAYYMVFGVKSRILRSLLYVIVVVPLFTSNIVRAFGWIVLLGRRGMVNDALVWLGIIERPIQILYTEGSIIIALSYIMMPFMVLTVAAVLQNIGRPIVEAARDLGATPLTTFALIRFPLSLPGVIAGSLIVFTLSVSAYVTPAVMSGGRVTVTSILIFQQYVSVFDFNFGATIAVTLLVTTLLLIGFYLLFLERRRVAR